MRRCLTQQCYDHTCTHGETHPEILQTSLLSKELRNANHNNIWGMASLLLLAKCTLCSPARGGRRRFSTSASLIRSRLERWLEGDVSSLCREVLDSPEEWRSNIKRCLQHAREGHYGRAIRAISSDGVASPGNHIAFQELLAKHPPAAASTSPRTVPPSLFIDAG